jgi:5-methylcytosine-specific restriction endonuclease McrA
MNGTNEWRGIANTPQRVPTLADWLEAAGKIGFTLLVGFGALSLIDEALNRPKARPKRSSVLLPFIEEDDLCAVEWIFYRTNGKCFYCGKRLSVNNRDYYGGTGCWEPDHFIPFSRNGADQPYNLVAACVACNRDKSNMYPWEFQPDRFRVGDRNPGNYLWGF